MKKFKVAPQTAKRIKAIIATAMALTLAVPTATYFSSKAAPSVEAEETVSVPEPIMSVDFEKGFLGEKEENGLEVVKSEEVLKFAELKDENGNYKYDENGRQIYGMTDTPFIENGDYKKGVVGNQPTTAFDAEKGNVLELDDTVEVPEFVKKDSDSLDSKYPVDTVLQEAVTAESQISLKNPFKGMDLSEEYNEATGWTKGVSMSYWVKVATDEDGTVPESNLIVFNNTSRSVIQKDDYTKYMACQEYAEGKEEYSLGTQEIMTDEEGNTYNVYKDYGYLIRFNPNYPLETEATKKGGWFIPEKPSKEDIEVTNAAGDTFKISSLATGQIEDEGLYDAFAYLYAETDDLTNGYSSKSKIRKETIKGSLSISTSNDFAFRTDNYKSEKLADNTIKSEGATITNPNSAEYNTVQDFEGSNQFYFNGDGTVTANPDTWHYVTVVLQNDWVDIFVDGEWKDPEEWFKYWEGSSFEGGFSYANAGKTFNEGRGIRAPYCFEAGNVDPWSADGTAIASPANATCITLLDWLSDEGTELYIGGNGVASGCTNMDYGTSAGTYLDDIEFYDVPLTNEQAVQLYENAKSEKEGTAEMPAEIESFTFDDGTMNGTNGTTMGNAATNIENPTVASDAQRGSVLALGASKTAGTSAVVLSSNPFAGKDLTAATVNFWVKEPAGKTGAVANSVAVSFSDTKKVKTHDKISDTYRGVEDKASTTLLYTTTACDGFFYEGASNGTYDSLKNTYFFSTMKNANTDPNAAGYDEEAAKEFEKYKARLNSLTEWHMVTVVLKNSGMVMYFDGELLTNNKFDNAGGFPNFFGPRFYDGYYQRIYDGYGPWYNASNNQFATPLMTFLTDATTSAYVGFANQLGSEIAFEKTAVSYFDNIRYYGAELTQDQVKALYEAEKTSGSVVTPDNGNGDKENVDGDVIDGIVTFAYGGVELKASVDVIPADAQLVLGLLGTESDAEAYAAMKDVLAKVEDFVANQYVIYTAKSADGSVTPNGTFKITFDLPAGYNKDLVVVVGEDGTVYEGTLSEDGTKVTIETAKFGNFAVVEKSVSNDDGSTLAEKSTTAGKTSDTTNTVLPIMIFAMAGAAVAVVYKRRVVRN